MEPWIVSAVLAVCMLLFIKEVLPVEVVALIGLMSLVITGVLSVEEAFRGFGDPAIVTIAALFVLSSALSRTGATHHLAQKIEALAKSRATLLVLLMMVTVTVFSAFMNNVAATAVLLPVTLGMAGKQKIHPGKVMMPLAFASMLGGTCTAIGTSTNIVLSNYLIKNDLPAFTLFEFTPVGLIIAGCGIAYMLTIGKWLLPKRGEQTFEESYHLRDYITEVLILNESPLIGKTISEAGLAEKMDLTVIGLSRDKKKQFVLRPDEILRSGDLLLVEGRLDNILKIKETFGIEIKSDFKLTDRDLQDHQIKLAEIVVAPQSDLIGKSLKDIRFRQRYRLVALALHRKGRIVRRKISQLPLELGDVLLVQGREENIHALRPHGNFLLLEELPMIPAKKQTAVIASLIFITVILLGGLQILPIVVAVIVGAMLMLLTRCIKLNDVYHSINWQTIVLIAGMTSIGVAMEKTGLANAIANFFVSNLSAVGGRGLLAGFFLLTVLMTQPMSNAAAALVVAPIAFSTAIGLDLNPRAFIMTVALAASCSFMTPLEPACALVYGPGKYKFVDFIKCGSILTIILMIVIIYFVPVFWPL